MLNDKYLTSFLEEVEKDYYNEDVTPRDLDQITTLIDRMEPLGFFRALRFALQTEDAPIDNTEDIIPHLDAIVKNLK